MSDSNPNLVTVFAPETGEPFETSKLNALDLTTHAGWTLEPKGAAPAAPEKQAETPPPAKTTTPPPAAKTEAPAKTTTPPAAKPEVKAEAPAKVEETKDAE